jgi:hypothetical protein
MFIEAPVKKRNFQTRLSKYCSNLARVRKTAEENKKEETFAIKENEKPWLYYDSSVFHYDLSFKKILPLGGFAELINQKGQVLMLDAFAPLSFIRELAEEAPDVYGGVALSLKDFRSDEQKEQDSSRNLFQFDGDVYVSRTWMGGVKDFLERNGKNGFDVITCLPMSGWNLNRMRDIITVDPTIDLFWTATNTLWKLLADDGSMFIEYWPYKNPEDLASWMELAKKRYGLNIDHDPTYRLVRINKNGSKVQQFPFPKI